MSHHLQHTYVKVLNEGANLNVWYQGNGPLLILIQGGGGDGARFNSTMAALCQHYTVATYDRRGNAQSTVARPCPLNPVQSARDVVAIIKALGFSKASVFGTSSGGLIALQLAASYPEYLRHTVVHEVPTLALLIGEKTDRIDEAYVVYETFLEHGAEAALEVFRASGAGRLDPQLKHTYTDRPREPRAGISRPPHHLDYFFEYEFIPFHIYTPPLAQVRANGCSVAVVQGAESGDKFYARVTSAQAEAMDSRHIIWPGAHAIFVDSPEEFAGSLRETLVELDGLESDRERTI